MVSLCVCGVRLILTLEFFRSSVIANLLVVFFIASLSSGSVLAVEGDPLEKINRQVFKFNDGIDRYTLKPLAKIYKKLVPKSINSGITRFFSNINDISVVFNDVAQLKFSQAGQDSARFIINTSIGLLGMFDVASKMNLKKHHEDFGQTLGFWGVPAGPYVVVPILGPYSARGVFAYPVDQYLTYYPHVSKISDRNTAKAIEFIDKRSTLLAAEAFVSGNRYAFVRDAYLQQREFMVHDGEVDDGFLDEDDFDDEEYEDSY